MYIELTPYDVLFFRNSKPFDMGEDFEAESYAFPPLTTLHGAIVAQFLRANKVSTADVENLKKIAEQIKLSGLFYRVWNRAGDDLGYFLPAPADLVPSGEMTEYGFVKCETLRMEKDEDAITSSPFSAFMMSSSLAKGVSGLPLMNVESFAKYMDGDKNHELLIAEQAMTNETKIGIKIDRRTNTVQDQHFYTLNFRRYESRKFRLSFVVKVDLPTDFESLTEALCSQKSKDLLSKDASGPHFLKEK